MFTVARHGNVYLDVFIEFRSVNVEMNDFCLTGISVQLAGDTVVKAHAYGYEHIAFLCVFVGSQTSMHAQHADIERMV